MAKDKFKNQKGNKSKMQHNKGMKPKWKMDRSKGPEIEDDMKDILADPRFAHVATDLRLRSMPQEEHKVILDHRFKPLLTDDKFYEKHTMDPRGRKGNFSTKENLLRLYRLGSDIESGDDEESEGYESDSENKQKEDGISRTHKQYGEKDDEDERTVKEMAEIPEELRERLQDLTQDFARGELFFSDDSSDDDSSTTDEEDQMEEFMWGELDHDAEWDTEENSVEETSRLALCNMDWDRVKAADIMKLFASFCPRGGSIKNVTIYPSEYGKERISEESVHGPRELVSASAKKEEEDELDDDDMARLERGKPYDESADVKHNEKLRAYQRNRLKYYYAVIDCDNVGTARTIYTECDRQPFEESGVLIDLRYIPSDMEFDDEAYDACDTNPDTYVGKHFVTSALQLAQPSLTWDEADPERERILSVTMAKALKGEEIDEAAVQEFIASGSDCGDDSDDEYEESESEDEDDKQSRIAKFKELIKEIDEKENKKRLDRVDLDQMFNADDDLDEDESEDEEDEEPEKDKKDPSLNPFEQYLEKLKNKKHKKKPLINVDEMDSKKSKKDKKDKQKMKNEAEDKEDNDLELMLMDEEDKDKKHFNMRKIVDENNEKKKRRMSKAKKMQDRMKEKQIEKQAKEEMDDFQVNTTDSRFSQLFSSADYNIDPSHSQFKRTKAMDSLISDIQNRKVTSESKDLPNPKRKKLDDKGKKYQELSQLVNKVKGKTNKRKK